MNCAQAVIMERSEETPTPSTSEPYSNCKRCGEILYRALHVDGAPVCSKRCAVELIEVALTHAAAFGFREGESDDD